MKPRIPPRKTGVHSQNVPLRAIGGNDRQVHLAYISGSVHTDLKTHTFRLFYDGFADLPRKVCVTPADMPTFWENCLLSVKFETSPELVTTVTVQKSIIGSTLLNGVCFQFCKRDIALKNFQFSSNIQ